MATDYSIGDRAYWVDKCKKRGWFISKLISEKEELEAENQKLKAEIKRLRKGHHA